MIGGIVTETIVLPDRVWINCEEEQSTRQSAIYVKRCRNSLAVKRGDSIWWQGEIAMWTPWTPFGQKGRKRVDVPIERIGFSGVARPNIPRDDV